MSFILSVPLSDPPAGSFWLFYVTLVVDKRVGCFCIAFVTILILVFMLLLVTFEMSAVLSCDSNLRLVVPPSIKKT